MAKKEEKEDTLYKIVSKYVRSVMFRGQIIHFDWSDEQEGVLMTTDEDIVEFAKIQGYIVTPVVKKA